MRQKFMPTGSTEHDRCEVSHWATVMVGVDGGFWVFESLEDAARFAEMDAILTDDLES